jgi:deoxyribodipyrimidine photo-lyase
MLNITFSIVSFIYWIIMPASVALSSSAIKTSASNIKFTFHWFRHQDLRLHDNPALSEAIKASKSPPNQGIVPIFCFDPRFVGGKTLTPFGSQKCSVRRAQFLLQSVADLRKNLTQKGSGLVVAVGKPEHIFSSIIKQLDQSTKDQSSVFSLQVFCQQEVASEELSVDRALQKTLDSIDGGTSKLVRIWGSTLYDPKDLPFKGGVQGIPDVFTPFRTQVEKV